MSEARNRAAIDALVAAINARNLGALDKVFTEDIIMERPPYQAVFVFQMRDGQIAKEIAYWSKPFPAPEWRAPWIERM